VINGFRISAFCFHLYIFGYFCLILTEQDTCIGGAHDSDFLILVGIPIMTADWDFDLGFPDQYIPFSKKKDWDCTMRLSIHSIAGGQAEIAWWIFVLWNFRAGSCNVGLGLAGDYYYCTIRRVLL